MTAPSDTPSPATHRAARPGRSWTVSRAISAILGLQLGLALVLVGNDLLQAVPQLALPSRAPSLDTPIAPGDQTRRYRPGQLPDTRLGDPDRPSPLPPPDNMPDRLRFEPLDGGLLLLTGGIEPGDADRFTDYLATADSVPVRVQLHSPGGSVADALLIGRQLRLLGAETEITAEQICLSACPYILAGGTERRVHRAALVGVHQHYFGENTALPAFLAVEDIQTGQARVVEHLDAMGIDLRLMALSLSTPPDEIYILTPEELADFALATALLPET